MYSAELLIRAGLLALLCGALAGCAALDTKPVAKTAPTATANGTGSASSASATAPAAAASATTAPQAARAPAAPVSPAVQRAFDDAVRALRAGRTEEAERGFRALATAHPEFGGPQANLGLIYLRADRPAEAVTVLEKAVAASPEQPRYFNQLGIAYRHQGQFAKARAAYEQAIELDPDYAAAYMNLGILHDLYLRDSSRALELYDRYLALSPRGDPAVSKWVVDLKNRQQRVGLLTIKEKP
jgi:Flp pilus assembly protein TadD